MTQLLSNIGNWLGSASLYIFPLGVQLSGLTSTVVAVVLILVALLFGCAAIVFNVGLARSNRRRPPRKAIRVGLLVASVAFVLALAIVIAVMLVPGQTTILILSPKEGQLVCERPTMKGTVRGIRDDVTKAQVWLVVYSMLTHQYWPQNPSTLNAAGEWETIPYIGDSRTPAGTRFHIRAFIGLDAPLPIGVPITGWPSGIGTSDVRTVSRDSC